MPHQTNHNYEELKSMELYLLSGITEEQIENARSNHSTDPEHWASPDEVMHRIDHDLFEGRYEDRMDKKREDGRGFHPH